MAILNQIVSQVPFGRRIDAPRMQFMAPPGISPAPHPALVNPNLARTMGGEDQRGGKRGNDEDMLSKLMRQAMRGRGHGGNDAGLPPGVPTPGGYPSGVMGNIMQAFGGPAGMNDPAEIAKLVAMMGMG